MEGSCSSPFICVCVSAIKDVSSANPDRRPFLLTCQHQMFLNFRLFTGRLYSRINNILLHSVLISFLLWTARWWINKKCTLKLISYLWSYLATILSDMNTKKEVEILKYISLDKMETTLLQENSYCLNILFWILSRLKR